VLSGSIVTGTGNFIKRSLSDQERDKWWGEVDELQDKVKQLEELIKGNQK